uniref:uncharacterized protein LOC122603090 n=1 Tax=Erigeron canadensis TaxID=72917 RepID=UPI001CB95AF4|nr:uncharacterized protein LOC122603090 [Erigeron canadensis]
MVGHVLPKQWPSSWSIWSGGVKQLHLDTAVLPPEWNLSCLDLASTTGVFHEKGLDQRTVQFVLLKTYLYCASFELGNIHLPFTDFYLSVLHHFKVYVSQINPYGNLRLGMFELACRAHDGEPTLTLFRRFYKLVVGIHSKSTLKMRLVSVSGVLESIKGWKSRFFYVNSSIVPPNFSLAGVMRKRSKWNMSAPLPSRGFSVSLLNKLIDQPIRYPVVLEPILSTLLGFLSRLIIPLSLLFVLEKRHNSSCHAAMGLSKILRNGYGNASFTPHPVNTPAVPLRDFTAELNAASEVPQADAISFQDPEACIADTVSVAHADTNVLEEYVDASTVPGASVVPFGTLASSKKRKCKATDPSVLPSKKIKEKHVDLLSPKESITNMLQNVRPNSLVRRIRLVAGGKPLSTSSGPGKGNGPLVLKQSEEENVAAVGKAKKDVRGFLGDGASVTGPECDIGEGKEGEDTDEDTGDDIDASVHAEDFPSFDAQKEFSFPNLLV